MPFDVGRHVVVRPRGERVDLHDPARLVVRDHRCVGAGGAVDAADAGDPGRLRCQHAVQGLHLAPCATSLDVELPLVIGHHLDEGLLDDQIETQATPKILGEPPGFSEEVLRVEEHDRGSGRVGGHQMDEDRILETGGEDEALAESDPGPRDDCRCVAFVDVGRKHRFGVGGSGHVGEANQFLTNPIGFWEITATVPAMTVTGLAYTPITGSFGAEFRDVDVRRDLAEGELLRLLEEHLVLVFRDQFLSHADQVALARTLGEPTPAHPVVPGHPDHPEILELDAQRGGKNARWHTDVTFVPTPPAASVLVADHTPAFGGDTLWLDLRTAYARLNPVLRQAVDQLKAVHRISPLAYWGEPFDSALTRDDAQRLFDDALKVPPTLHPVVRVHPSTGRPALFVNPGFTTHIAGLSRIESDNLLKLLYEHMTQPEFTLRHRWQPGDVVMWDNRATAHYAIDDYGDADRRMRRVTIRGSRMVGPDGFESRVADDPMIAIR